MNRPTLRYSGDRGKAGVLRRDMANVIVGPATECHLSKHDRCCYSGRPSLPAEDRAHEPGRHATLHIAADHLVDRPLVKARRDRLAVPAAVSMVRDKVMVVLEVAR